MANPVVCRGVTYKSEAACARALGVHRTTVIYHLNRGTIDQCGLGRPELEPRTDGKQHGGRKREVKIGPRTFESVAALARALGRGTSNVHKSLKAGELAHARILQELLRIEAMAEQWEAVRWGSDMESADINRAIIRVVSEGWRDASMISHRLGGKISTSSIAARLRPMVEDGTVDFQHNGPSKLYQLASVSQKGKLHVVICTTLAEVFPLWRDKMVTWDTKAGRGMDKKGRAVVFIHGDKPHTLCGLKLDTYEVDEAAWRKARKDRAYDKTLSECISLCRHRVKNGQ